MHPEEARDIVVDGDGDNVTVQRLVPEECPWSRASISATSPAAIADCQQSLAAWRDTPTQLPKFEERSVFLSGSGCGVKACGVTAVVSLVSLVGEQAESAGAASASDSACPPPEDTEATDGLVRERVDLINAAASEACLTLQKAAATISNLTASGHVVLIQSRWGASRGAAVALASMLVNNKMTLFAAVEALQALRPIVYVYPVFMDALLELERDVCGQQSFSATAYRQAFKTRCSGSKAAGYTWADKAFFKHNRLPHPATQPCHKSDEIQRLAVFGAHVMMLRNVLSDPVVVQVEGFVTREEAGEVIAMANALCLKPSRVVGQGHTGARTSSSCKLYRSSALVARIVCRAAWVLGVAPEVTEPIQVVHYERGQEYKQHLDWFQPEGKGFDERVREQGQRTFSVFVYLCDCPAGSGGCTAFPKLGKKFRPKAGRAVIWSNVLPDGAMDERVLHAGEPPCSGEKYGMNLWFRERSKDQQKHGIASSQK
eukprot:m.117093 g.117093  ORF g.117093 m.117093 type:complete len:487 (+) comp16392_c1_seq2:341-1801(+)